MLELQLLLNGILLGGIYSLLAIGLNLIFGVMRVINFAHGELVVLGALFTASAFGTFGVNPFVALLFVVPVMFLVGCVIQRVVIEPLVGGPEMVSLLATFGLSLLLINVGLLVWGADERSVSVLTGAFRVGGLAIPKVRLLTFIVAAGVTLALFAFLRLSAWGRALRATAQEPAVAQTCGIDVRRIRLLAFGLATGFAAVAGNLLVMMVPIDPQTGGLLVLKAFAVVVLGGLGNVFGALIASLLLANAEVWVAFYGSPVFSDAVAFLVLIGVLLLKRRVMLESAS